MKRLAQLLTAGLVAFPLIVAAQTPNPAKGPATNGPPPAMNKSETSAPGSSGTPAAGAHVNTDSSTSGQGDASTSTSVSTPKAKRKPMKKSDTPKNGDVPTYPAPAPDGTPTK